MSNHLSLRNFPPALRLALRVAALQQGVTMEALIVQLLGEALAKSKRGPVTTETPTRFLAPVKPATDAK